MSLALSELFDVTSRRYRGFLVAEIIEESPWFNAEQLSRVFLDSPGASAAMIRMGPLYQMALFGWIDQAVFDIAVDTRGDRSGLNPLLKQLDAYRPDQNGDLALAVGDVGWKEAILFRASRDHRRVTISTLAGPGPSARRSGMSSRSSEPADPSHTAPTSGRPAPRG